MKNFADILKGGDLRSVGEVNKVISLIKTQKDFDELFSLLKHENRIVGMRAADALEKITQKNPHYLISHSASLIQIASNAVYIEQKWHLGLMLVRLPLADEEADDVWKLLKTWTVNPEESRIVRVNALEGLSRLAERKTSLRKELYTLFHSLEKENIPSLSARIRKLRKRMDMKT